MITKLTIQKLFQGYFNIFYFSKLIHEGRNVIAEMPTVQLPVRGKYDEEDRFSKKRFYQMNNYLRKDRPPRCRYYALQYKNRIYHVFNAYYYPMGRMIGQISTFIRGKNSPLYRNSEFNPKNGDICVVVNAADPLFTGKKLLFKQLKYHTGFIGHLRSYSYRHVLNNKPELLYHFLLRKFMPKNKLSMKYLQNLKIYRGPIHNIPNLPQFAPDKNIYEYLPQSNLIQYIRLNPDVKILTQSTPGLAKQQFGRDFQYFKPAEQIQKQIETQNAEAEDTSKLHKKPPITKKSLNCSPKQLGKLRRKQQRYLQRYREVRAPYRKKQIFDKGFLYITDERKARKMEEYKILADQDLPQEDQEVIEDPFGRKAKENAAKKASDQNKK